MLPTWCEGQVSIAQCKCSQDGVGAVIRPTPPPSVEEASAAVLAAGREYTEAEACSWRLIEGAEAEQEVAESAQETHRRLECLVAQKAAAALEAEGRLDAMRGAPRRLKGAVGRARERAALQNRDAALAVLRQAQQELAAAEQRFREAADRCKAAARLAKAAHQRFNAAGACVFAAMNTLIVAQAARQAAQRGRPCAGSQAADEDALGAGSGC